ncbi:MAG TPA: TrkH family potassium uptake protein [Bacillales bacterium]
MKRRPAREIHANQKWHFNPPQILALGFFAIILIGTVFLKLPIATKTSISWLDAFFTATSAVTVTCSMVVDPLQTFTRFGQIIILTLVQVGGLGIMTFAIFVFLIMGKRISFKQRLLVQNALNQTTFGGIIRMVKNLLILALSIEAAAAFLLTLYWGPIMGWGKALYYSIFYSVSAFNDAGFSLWPDSLSRWVGDPVVNILISTLVIIGGLGFTVLMNLWDARHFKDLTLHTKFMLIGTVVINAFAFIMILFLEFNNPATLGNLPLGSKLWAAFFQAISARTAGFTTVDIGAMHEATLFLIIILMYIGAGSTSAGGGIKVTTFIVLLLSVVKILRGKEDAVAFGRTIKDSIFMRAFAIVVVSLTFIFIGIFILSLTEQASFFEVVFEVVASFSTTGFSVGLTQSLSATGQVVVMFLMFIGKLGPLTLVFSLAKPEVKKIRYPEGRIFIG